MDEIRVEVFDYLYKNGPASVKTIAGALEQTADAIQAVAANEWFVRQDDVLAIAVNEPVHAESRGEATRSSEETSSRALPSSGRINPTSDWMPILSMTS